MNTTANKLKSLRESKGMSQADCAKALGIDRTTYAKYENGGSVKRNVEKLASFFNVTTDYLLGIDHPASVKTNKDQQPQGSAILLRAQEKLPDEKLKELETMAQFFLDNYGKNK